MPGTRTKARQPRDVSINLRANQRQRTLIDRAAEALGKNRTPYFTTALDRPPADNPSLRRLLTSKAPWER